MSDLFDLPFEDEDDPPALSEPPSPDARVEGTRRIFTVTELTVRVRDHLEERFFEVWVEGELTGVKIWNTGHLYFSLKDSSSLLKGLMFRSALRYLKFKPVDGLKVVARGKISVYEPKGEYQIVCEHLEPQGLGALQLAFDQLKKRLQAEGLFDVSKKRPLPALPRKIGVVTSLDGAAIRDILKVLRRRYRNVHVVIRPTKVQGEGAAAEIAHGLRQIVKVPQVDVVIVGRGGGSMEDLWAFNEEPVARAISIAPIPVISAVGHESDVTIADLVADVRAPTPSAAAELVVARKEEFSNRINRLWERLDSSAHSRVQRLSRRVHELTGRRGMAGYTTRLAMTTRRVDELTRRLEACELGRRLARNRTALVAVDSRLRQRVTKRLHDARARFGALSGRLDTLSPLKVLARGYAVCWNEDRSRAIRDSADVKPGDTVHVSLSRGSIDAKVSRKQ